MAGRISEINRSFATPLLIGGGCGILASELMPLPGGRCLQMEPSFPCATAVRGPSSGQIVVADEEFLPFREGAFDLVIGGMTLHWVNDLVGALTQLRIALVPDGLFIGALLGGATLHELRECLAEAEIEITGSLSLRVLPMAEIAELGGLLLRAGFALPVADVDRIRLEYAGVRALVRDLRDLGETSAIAGHQPPLTRAILDRADELYRERHPLGDGIGATFEVIHLTGWKPGPGQPQPLRPGSASARLADALGTSEVPLARDE